jgi:hypothetical protein
LIPYATFDTSATCTPDQLGPQFRPPTLPAERLREIAICFGIEGRFQPLDGEQDQNNRVTTRMAGSTC